MSSIPTRYLIVRSVAIVMVGLEIVIHADLTPTAFRYVPYIGVLFVIAIVSLSGALVSLLLPRGRVVGWSVGAVVCAGMFVAFVISRTVGLPSYHEAWTSDSGLGIVSLPPELIFIAAAVHAVRIRRTRAAEAYPLRLEDRERQSPTSALLPRTTLSASNPSTRPAR